MGAGQQEFSTRWAYLVFGALVIFVFGVKQGYDHGLYLLKVLVILVGLTTGLYLGRWKKPPYTSADLVGAICVWFCLGTLVGVVAGIVGYTEITCLANGSGILSFIVILFVSDSELNGDLYSNGLVLVPFLKKKVNWVFLVIQGVIVYILYGYVAISHLNQSHETIIGGLLIGVILSIIVFFRWKNAIKLAAENKYSLEWLIRSSIIPKIGR